MKIELRKADWYYQIQLAGIFQEFACCYWVEKMFPEVLRRPRTRLTLRVRRTKFPGSICATIEWWIDWKGKGRKVRTPVFIRLPNGREFRIATGGMRNLLLEKFYRAKQLYFSITR